MRKIVDWRSVGLGTKPDTALARELKLPRENIKNARKKLGIPAFIGTILLQEDIPCRSIYEAMYDAYLHWHDIPHKHEVKVPGMPYIADFQVEHQYIEIAGMLHFPHYKEKHIIKRKAYEIANIAVTWLTIEEVDIICKDCPLPLKFRVQRKCLDCGKQTHDLVKEVCRKCYIKRWHKEGTHQAICHTCETAFSYHDTSSHKYCSRKCYWKSLEFEWPSWEWIDEQLMQMSVRQLSIQMNVKYTSLWMHIRRRKQRA